MYEEKRKCGLMESKRRGIVVGNERKRSLGEAVLEPGRVKLWAFR